MAQASARAQASSSSWRVRKRRLRVGPRKVFNVSAKRKGLTGNPAEFRAVPVPWYCGTGISVLELFFDILKKKYPKTDIPCSKILILQF